MTTYRQFLEAKAAVAPATAGGRHHMLITRQDADLANGGCSDCYGLAAQIVQVVLHPKEDT